MATRSVTHNTFVIERSYPVTPERVFDAFSDPVKKRRWFAESEGFEVDSFEMDFKVGGIERSEFRVTGTSPIQGTLASNDTVYQDMFRIAALFSLTP